MNCEISHEESIRLRRIIRSRIAPLPAWTPPDTRGYQDSLKRLDRWLRRLKRDEVVFHVAADANLSPKGTLKRGSKRVDKVA
jgi:hypothetical protein